MEIRMRACNYSRDGKPLRQTLPGTRRCEWETWMDEDQTPDDARLKTDLGVMEYAQALVRRDNMDVEHIYHAPKGVDPVAWQYEHIRLFLIEFNDLLTDLCKECDRTSCPKMTASHEWQYLCAAHKKPQDVPTRWHSTYLAGHTYTRRSCRLVWCVDVMTHSLIHHMTD